MLIGKTLSHYEITEKLGAGGMGEVYLANDSELDRRVAIKFLPSGYSSKPGLLDRAPAFASAWLSYAYGASGDLDRARAEVKDLTRMSLDGHVTPFDNALVALGLGEHARAVSLLEQAYAMDSQWLGWLRNDKVFDPLRADPRFVALMKKVGFAVDDKGAH